MQNIYNAIFNKSADSYKPIIFDAITTDKDVLERLFGNANPYSIDNFYTTFKEISEVQFPIKFICDRVKNANFVLKNFSDDTINWDVQEVNKFLENPNPFYSFNDLAAYYFQMKLALGNAFLYANTNPSFSKSLWKYCDSYYILPTQNITIDAKKINPYFVDDINEIINYYNLTSGYEYGYKTIQKIDPKLVLHSRDFWDFSDLKNNLLSFSRLQSVCKPLANLIAVYEARNVIYTKRGALGAIISKTSDATGLLPMTTEQEKEVNERFNKRKGFGKDKDLFIISKNPIDFIKIGATISELQPFEETLQDAIQIAGAFGINKELIPRNDNSTFSNQNTAEVSVYNNVIMPLVATFLSELTQFLGLKESGYYLDADWSNVSVLQEGKHKEQQKKKIISERCKVDFMSGIITLNDWRAELDMEAMEKPLYKKTIIEMNDSELTQIKNILSFNTQKPKQEEL